jgi:hypothetical protein
MVHCYLLFLDQAEIVCYVWNAVNLRRRMILFIWFVALTVTKQQTSLRKVRRPCRICHGELPISQVCCCCCIGALFLSLTLQRCRHHYVWLPRNCGSQPSLPFRQLFRLPTVPLWRSVPTSSFSSLLYLLLGHMTYKELPMCPHAVENTGDVSVKTQCSLGFIWRWVALWFPFWRRVLSVSFSDANTAKLTWSRWPIYEWVWTTGGMTLRGGNRNSRKNPVPAPLCSP